MKRVFVYQIPIRLNLTFQSLVKLHFILMYKKTLMDEKYLDGPGVPRNYAHSQ